MGTKQIYNLKIDEELRDLLPPLTHDEYKQLEENISKNGYDERNPIFVWHGYIADGHNRYEICQKQQIPFSITDLGYDNREDVMIWMINNQIGRRNLPEKQLSYLRGKEYEAEKKKVTNKNGINQHSEVGGNNYHQPTKTKTAEQLGKQHGVTEKTIRNDAQFSNALDSISKNIPELKNKILTGEIPVTKKSVVEIANKSENEQKEIVTQLSSGKSLNDILPKKSKFEINQESKIESKQIPIIKKCLKCKKEKDMLEFLNGSDFCNECMEHINDPIERKDQIDDSTEIGKIAKDLKTEKVIDERIIVKSQIDSVKSTIEERIDSADDSLFGDYGIANKMIQIDKDLMISYLNQLEGKLLKLKNRIENIKIIKGDNE